MNIPKVRTADYDLPGEQLHDTITVRQPCKHNRHERHKDWPPTEPQPIWCPGGQQMILQRAHVKFQNQTLWIEIPDV